MPQFFFHLCDGDGLVSDMDGASFPDLSAARGHAIAGLRDIMAEDVRKGQLNLGCFIEIEDADGALVTTVQFLDAVELRTSVGSRRGLPVSG